jgi:hypothetical protein
VTKMRQLVYTCLYNPIPLDILLRSLVIIFKCIQYIFILILNIISLVLHTILFECNSLCHMLLFNIS